jgi:hypothetical protein
MRITDFVNSFDKPTGPRLRMKRAKPMTLVEIAIDDARRRAASGEWAGAKGAVLVGLYAMCHRMVYGIIPSELFEVPTFRAAAKMAAKAMHELFGDDPAEVAAFVKWSWQVEKRKNEWAQTKSVDRKHLGWRAQFCRSLETDYRIWQKQGRR